MKHFIGLWLTEEHQFTKSFRVNSWYQEHVWIDFLLLMTIQGFEWSWL